MTARKCVILAAALGLLAASPAAADMTYSFADFPYLLQHEYWYSWGIDWTLPDDERITEATLTITLDEISRDPWNVLYVHLLDDAVTDWGEDPGDYSDHFATYSGEHELIAEYRDGLPEVPDTIEFTFSELGLLGTLTDYIRNGHNLSIAMDPDCVFIVDSVELEITTVVPAPGAALLIGLGLVSLAGLRRYVRHSDH